jgi:hypothetical protein
MATQNKPDNMLLRCYRDYVAELGPVTETDVYAGFAGVMGGLMLSVVGWLTYLWIEFGSSSREALWTVRELAFGTAGVGVPMLLVGSIAGLMGLRDLGRSAIAGSVMCAAGLVLFGVTYPGRWNVIGGTDYSAIGVTLYGLGLALLLFRMGGAVSCRLSE